MKTVLLLRLNGPQRAYFYLNALFLCFFSFQNPLIAQWNPHAGLITPYTVGATATATTVVNPAMNVLDGDNNTAWMSNASLPTGYVSRLNRNIFLNQNGATFSGTGNISNYGPATDGNTNTPLVIPAANGVSLINITFNTPRPALLINAKFALSTAVTLNLYAFRSPVDSVLLGTYTNANIYSFIRYDLPANDTLTGIKIWGNGGFSLFEVSCLAALPHESVVVDMGSLHHVGIIETRHWGGGSHVLSTRLYGSADSVNWTFLKTLDPAALARITTQITPQMLRYIKVEHTMNTANYVKCYVWEIAAYDESGPVGSVPPPQKSQVTVRNLLGVNSIWHWGYNNLYQPNNHHVGPWLFDSIVSQARSYHNLNWDVTDPDQDPDFQNIYLHGGLGASWCNWDQEYAFWQAAGLVTEATIQFHASSFPPSMWNTPYESAYNYGRQFALHFGPTHGNGLVKAMEVGNEPWEYDSAFYRTVLRGMAKGAKEADPAMEVFPCALQAANPHAEAEDYKHYMGARITPAEAPYLDGINLHSYAFKYNSAGVRYATFPEDRFSYFWEILNAIRFRNQNMPGKKIYVTEWGWDSDGGNNCTHSECVSAREQSVYAVRCALLMMRLGVERAHWYYFYNTSPDPYSSLFARSGLIDYSFQKKPGFRAFEAMNRLLGDRYFLGTVQEDTTAYVYKMGAADNTLTHLVAWRPIHGDSVADTRVISIPLPSGMSPIAAWKIEGINGNGECIALPTMVGNNLIVTVSAVPTVIQLTPFTIQTTQANVSCPGGANGTASVVTPICSSPYSYIWSNGGTTQTITDLAPGTYTVTVTVGGALATASVVIAQPPSMVVEITKTDVTCPWYGNGSAIAHPSGGTAPYFYAWSSGSQGVKNISLSPGTYTVTVTDVFGCTKTGATTITQPDVINIAMTITPPSCAGGATGAAMATVTGGTGTKTYLWSTGATTQTATGLAAGTYTLTVTDANLCTKVGSATVTNPIAMTLSFTTVMPSCFGGANGTAKVTAANGTGAKTYLWSTGPTTQTATGLSAGTYSVTVSDSRGCTKVGSVTVAQPTEMTLTLANVNPACFGGATGSSKVTATGGTGAKTYLWSNGTTAQTATNLTAGTYTVTVTDAKGCTKTTSATLADPALLDITGISSVSSTVAGKYNVTVNATGGTGNKTYRRSTGATTFTGWANNNTFNFLAPGTYTFQVKDAKGCTDSQVQVVPVGNLAQPLMERTDEVPDNTAFELSPNPAMDKTQVVFLQEMPTQGIFEVTDASGKVLQQFTMETLLANGRQIDLSQIPAGVVFVSWQLAGSERKVRRLVIVR